MTWTPELPPDVDEPEARKLEWLIRSFEQISRWSSSVSMTPSGTAAQDASEMSGSCISGSPGAFSASTGGAAIPLDDATVPGKVIHANAPDSGVNDVIACMWVYNPNPESLGIWHALQGSGIAVPTSRSQMRRQEIPPTLGSPTPVPIPCVILPGYTLHISADAGSVGPMQVFGLVDRHIAAGVLGYGGLLQAAGAATFNIAIGAWETVPFDDVQVTNPINVVQDVANNRVQINAEGIWYATIYVAFECDKDASNDRILNARFYDETAGTPLTANPFPASVENNANNGSLWPTVLYEVPAALVGHWFRLELGGSAHAFNNVEVKKAGAAFVRISPNI